jgi:5-methylcytosine-specific restriction endonuclease McrA
MADKRKYRDRAEYLKKAVDKRRKKLREMAVQFRGGRCQLCGYNKCTSAFEFHHIDPHQKDFDISMNGLTRAWSKVRAELRRCVLLCANCHREIHAGITQLPKKILVEKFRDNGEG